MSQAIECYRCGKRCNIGSAVEWNIEYVAGLELGAVCPDCQSAEEDIEAQVNEAMGTTQRIHDGYLGTDPSSAVAQLARLLVDAYPTPAVMRAKADKLASARRDEQALAYVSLMRRIADGMETGELYEDK